MKKHEWFYSFKAGFQGLRRHPLLTAAAVTTLSLMLFLLGAFTAISMNANHLSAIAAQQPPIEITMLVSAQYEEVDELAQYLHSHSHVQELVITTPRQNFEQFKEDMGKEELWRDFDYTLSIPYTMSVRLDDPGYGETFREEVMEFTGVKEVLMESRLMALLDTVKSWIRRVGILVFAVLAVTSAVVVANTVRIAVLSRSREINIMKYVGSTNAFIRTPFIVEGAVIGLAGTFFSSLASALLYNRLLQSFGGQGTFSLLSGPEVISRLIMVNALTGVLLCVLVSALSVRKYARV